jgi:hypothetical protein
MIIYIDRRQYLVSRYTLSAAERLAALRTRLRSTWRHREQFSRAEYRIEVHFLILSMRTARSLFFEQRMAEARASSRPQVHPIFAGVLGMARTRYGLV